MEIKRNRIKQIAFGVALAVLFFAGGMIATGRIGSEAAPAVALTQTQAEPQAQDVYTGNPIVQIVKKSSPAVVNIDTETMVTQNSRRLPFQGDPFFEEFFGQIVPPQQQQRQVPRQGKGSGFIIDKEGYVLTNNHVIEGADKIKVTLMDGRSFDAERVGQDPTFDLAIIKIKANGLPILELGDSDKTEIGEWVVAIGNPFGLENTVTSGVISAKNRTLQAPGVNFQGFMQTDAAINPGNSGGPLIDLNGKVIGINTAIVPYAQGLGFAVPINMAKQIMDDLIKHGEVRRGWLGVTVQALTPSLVEAYKIPVSEGAIIADLQENGPAAKGGLRRADVITAISGEKIKNSQDVVFAIRKKMQGERVNVEVYRDGKKLTVNVTLGEIEGGKKEQPRKESSGRSEQQAPRSAAHMGITVGEITNELRDRYRLTSNNGLVVLNVERGSQGQRIGVQPGDVVLEINRMTMARLSDWDKAMSSNNKVIAMLISRGSTNIFISVEQ